MDVDFNGEGIFFEKVFTDLDDFTVSFVSILHSQGICHVIVSGYVPILFGRNRASEDIDIIFERMSRERFAKLWNVLDETFECVNAIDCESAYDNYLSEDTSIRFAHKNEFIPNVELKFPKNELDEWTLTNRKKVTVNSKLLYISPLELQIPYKLFLGSEKDIEDAKYLHTLFKDRIDQMLMGEFLQKLNVRKAAEKYLR
jgi:hypothetical protein